MNAWLYPVSANATHRFRDRDGRSRPVSFEAIRDAVLAGSFPSPAEWSCVQNATNAAPGDELFLYTGAVGIFAAGRVRGARETNQTTTGGAALWMLAWALDAARTKRLLRRPVPPEKVRAHVHPRATIRDFTTGARALRRLLR